MPFYSIADSAVLVWLQKYGNFRTDNRVVLSATTVMLLLNRNNKGLHCKEGTLLNESPVEHIQNCTIRFEYFKISHFQMLAR